MSTQVHEIFIRTSSAELWRAIVEGERTELYFFGSFVTSTWQPQAPIVYTGGPSGPVTVDGIILELEPEKHLSHTWTVRYDPSLGDEVSRVTYLIEPRGPNVKLTVRHELGGAPKTAKHLATDAWSIVLSSLKSLLETGQALVLQSP